MGGIAAPSCYGKAVFASTAGATGSVIAGRYRVVSPLGRGGMGAVYEVIDTVTDRVRALKLVAAADDEDARVRFRNEGMVGGRVESPHVVDVFDRGHDEALGVFFLVMDRLRGEDLGALLAREQRLSREATTTIITQVAKGLDALHGEAIVHRDLKPENVFLAREGASFRAVIVDLGLAKSFVSGTTARTTRTVGTPVFMAPEQLRGDGWVDARADIYALGQLTFALLAGRAYFAPEHGRATNLYALLLSIAAGPPEPASERARAFAAELPPSFDAWFATATHPDPSERFESAGEAASTLETALTGAAVAPPIRTVARRASRGPEKSRHGSRTATPRRAVVLALAVGMAVGGGLLLRGAPSATTAERGAAHPGALAEPAVEPKRDPPAAIVAPFAPAEAPGAAATAAAAPPRPGSLARPAPGPRDDRRTGGDERAAMSVRPSTSRPHPGASQTPRDTRPSAAPHDPLDSM